MRDQMTIGQSVSQSEHAPQQHCSVAASTFKPYSFSILMATLQAVTQPIPNPAK